MPSAPRGAPRSSSPRSRAASSASCARAEVAARSSRATLLEERLRSGKSGIVEADGRAALPHRAGAAGEGRRRSAPCISARRWRRWREASISTSRSSIRAPPSRRRSAFPTCRSWPNGRTRRCRASGSTATPRSLALTHDPKIDDPALDAALRAECFYIGALGSQEDPCPPRRAADGRGLRRGRHRPHPCADRARHRRRQPGRDRRRRSSPRSSPTLRRDRRRGVKFGPVPVEEAVGAHRRPFASAPATRR